MMMPSGPIKAPLVRLPDGSWIDTDRVESVECFEQNVTDESGRSTDRALVVIFIPTAPGDPDADIEIPVMDSATASKVRDLIAGAINDARREVLAAIAGVPRSR